MKKEYKIKVEQAAEKSVRRQYHQRYRKEWEKFPSFCHWLQSSNDGYSAHCKICDVNVLARLASIKQHHITRKHQDAMKSSPLSKVSKVCKFISINPFFQAELEVAMQLPSDTSLPPKAPQHKVRHKQRSRVKAEPQEERLMDEDELGSNDSILDDLLRTEPLDQEFETEEHDPMEEHDVDGSMEQETYVEEIMHLKHDRDFQEELNADVLSEDNIMTEFDLFGKSMSLQLNNMELEDALLCQERLQVVLTEFRLKILKRRREGKRNA
ncbi:hypothetical protein KR018_005576 [Drosophila ironensis]|nr:hypothetical protein KR018_005576 [Drosophila ironensis]